MVKQEGALEVSTAPAVWAEPYPNVPLAASYTMASAGGVSQATITADLRDIHGLSTLRDSSLKHQSQQGIYELEEGELVPPDQLVEGELEADISHERKIRHSL